MSQPSPAWLRFGYAADDAYSSANHQVPGRELTRPPDYAGSCRSAGQTYRQIAVASSCSIATVEFAITSLPSSINAVTQYSQQRLAVIAANATHEAKEKSGRANTRRAFRRSARYTPTYFHQHGALGLLSKCAGGSRPSSASAGTAFSIQQSVPAPFFDRSQAT